MNITYISFDCRIGKVYTSEKDGKVIYISLNDPDGKKMFAWLRKKFPEAKIEESEDSSSCHDFLLAAKKQILEYLDGKIRHLDFEYEMTGTDFQKAVWLNIAEIPWGETKSYGTLADKIGKPGSARAVGAACKANPLPLLIPCHRVVGTNGSLTGFSGGIKLKKLLLELERSK